MKKRLTGKKIAILIDNGFEEVEMTEPRKALQRQGAEVLIVSPQTDSVCAWRATDWGDEFDVDMPLDQALAEEFDGLLLPGGVMNPDQLRINPRAVEFVRAFIDEGKSVAAICHGPWTLVEADAVRGRRVTSYPSIKTDLRNAGADWVDEEVVVDHGLITSRKPDDIPAFNRAMIESFATATHHVSAK